MKRLQIASALFMLALTGIMGIAFAARQDTAQVIIVTPLDQGDTTPTYAEYPTAEALICEGDCACYFYSFEDTDGTQVVMAECGQVAERTTATPPVMLVTPTPVWQGPTLTPTIERVIGRYCFTGTTFQNIRTGPDGENAVIGRLYPQQNRRRIGDLARGDQTQYTTERTSYGAPRYEPTHARQWRRTWTFLTL